VDRLLALSHEVIGYDNFSKGLERNLQYAYGSRNFRLVRADVMDPESLKHAMAGSDTVFRLAAKRGCPLWPGAYVAGPNISSEEQNKIGAFNVVAAMRPTGAVHVVK
jgi:nucleoside-diphosphate-sugar epimerase